MQQLTLILDNVRSAHNVGGIIRNAAAFGAVDILCVGITPYPKLAGDTRLPHVAQKATAQIHKTSLGSEQHCHFSHYESLESAISSLRGKNYYIYALELHSEATPLGSFTPTYPCALILGNEVTGISPQYIAKIDAVVQIETTQAKQSLNVTTASGIALYHFAHNSSMT